MLKAIVISLLAGAAGGVVLYKRLTPPETIEVIKDRIVTVTRTKKNADGSTTEITRRTEDQTDTSRRLVPVATLPAWSTTLGYNTDKLYYADVAKRMIGNLYVGASITSDVKLLDSRTSLGVVVRYQF